MLTAIPVVPVLERTQPGGGDGHPDAVTQVGPGRRHVIVDALFAGQELGGDVVRGGRNGCPVGVRGEQCTKVRVDQRGLGHRPQVVGQDQHHRLGRMMILRGADGERGSGLRRSAGVTTRSRPLSMSSSSGVNGTSVRHRSSHPQHPYWSARTREAMSVIP